MDYEKKSYNLGRFALESPTWLTAEEIIKEGGTGYHGREKAA